MTKESESVLASGLAARREAEVASIQGRGAWTTRGKGNGSRYYCYVEGKPLDGMGADLDLDHLAVNYGVKAFQYRLDELGFRGRSGGRLVVDGLFGIKTRRAAKWFQQSKGFNEDGIIGSTTSQELWKQLIWSHATEAEVPPELLWGMTALESAFDPGAVSSLYKQTNGPDYGLCQINTHFNPAVTMEAAFTPSVALVWSARHLRASLDEYSGKGPDLRVSCAIAHHNSPVQAKDWFLTGEPPSEQIAQYVALVRSRMATADFEE